MEKSVAYLQQCQDGVAAEAELYDDISDEHVELWRKGWLPHIERAKQILTANKVLRENWPQDLHWKWDKKTDWSRGLLSMRRFALTCKTDLQGLMLVNLTKMTARLAGQQGKDIAYVEFLSTAPWNRPDLTPEPVYRGVGLVMMRVAIELSQAEGFRGRIGLHSLLQAAAFYRKCGMTELGPDTSYYGLIHFEMTETQAAKFCE